MRLIQHLARWSGSQPSFQTWANHLGWIRLHTLRLSSFTTGAVVGNRYLYLTVSHGGQIIVVVPAAVAHTAGVTLGYQFSALAGSTVVQGVGGYHVPLPIGGLIVPPEATIDLLIANADPGDSFPADSICTLIVELGLVE